MGRILKWWEWLPMTVGMNGTEKIGIEESLSFYSFWILNSLPNKKIRWNRNDGKTTLNLNINGNKWSCP